MMPSNSAQELTALRAAAQRHETLGRLTVLSRDRTPLKTEVKWGVATVVVALLLSVGGFVWLLCRYLPL